MKNLLSMPVVSTLVGTSASNLKQVFMNNVVNHGFKSNQIKNKDISTTNQNVSNPFLSKQLFNGIASGISLLGIVLSLTLFINLEPLMLNAGNDVSDSWIGQSTFKLLFIS